MESKKLPDLPPLPEEYKHPNKIDEHYYNRADGKLNEFFRSQFTSSELQGLEWTPLFIRQVSAIMGAISGMSWTRYMLKIVGYSDPKKCYDKMKEIGQLGFFSSKIKFKIAASRLGHGELTNDWIVPSRNIPVEYAYVDVHVEGSTNRVLGPFVQKDFFVDSYEAYPQDILRSVAIAAGAFSKPGRRTSGQRKSRRLSALAEANEARRLSGEAPRRRSRRLSGLSAENVGGLGSVLGTQTPSRNLLDLTASTAAKPISGPDPTGEEKTELEKGTKKELNQCVLQ